MKHSAHAIILGGTRGLGRVVARLFAADGMKVSVLGSKEPDPADRKNRRVCHYRADLTDKAKADEALTRVVRENGAPNYLVFAQRYRGEKNVSWSGELELMLTVPRNVLSLLSDRFAKTGDRAVVFVSSPAGRFFVPEQDEAYHVTRAALCGLARWYAVKWGARGIRFNIATPGAHIRELPGGKKFVHPAAAGYAQFVPLGRIGKAADTAKVVRFLCSEEAGFVTGQELMVDGGASLLGQEALAMRFIQSAEGSRQPKKVK